MRCVTEREWWSERIQTLILITGCAFLFLLPAEPSAQTLNFADATTTAGLIGSEVDSIAIVDLNKDDLLDLYVTERTAVSHLFINQGDDTFTDSAIGTGLSFTGLGEGAIAGFWDPDRDGNADLFLGRTGTGLHMVNQGNGTFQDEGEAAGLTVDGRTCSITPLDYDRDGELDLYLGRGGWNTPQPHLLFRNLANGSFSDATTAAGLGQSLAGGGAIAADFDNDGDSDLFIIQNGTNLFYRNNDDGTFTELTEIGISDAGVGNGATAGDYDNDGDIDVLRVNTGSVRLFRNNWIPSNAMNFTDVTVLAGLNIGTSGHDVGDADFADFDNDGDLDVYVAIKPDSPSLQDRLYQNNGAGLFTDVTVSAGLEAAEVGRLDGRCSTADLDGDGRLDIILTDYLLAYIKNTTQNPGHWISVAAQGTVSNREGIGARAWIEQAVDFSRIGVIQQSLRGKPRGTQPSPWLHFGCGAHAGQVHVRVIWPSGNEERFGPFDVDRRVSVVEGSGVLLSGPEITGAPSPFRFTEGSGFEVNVQAGDSPKVRQLEIVNSGNATLRITELSLTGQDAADYSLPNMPDLPLVIAPSQSRMVDVRFNPDESVRTTGLSAVLRLKTNDLDESIVEIPIVGDAVPVGLARFTIE